MRRTWMIGLVAAGLCIGAPTAAWSAPAAPATESVPVAKLSEVAQTLAAALGPDLVAKESGRCGAPPFWSGETQCEYLAFFAPDENPDKDARPKVEMWLTPADYKGDRLPSRVGTYTPVLHSVRKEGLLFVRADFMPESEDHPGNVLPHVRKKLPGAMGFEKAADPERTPASVKADPPSPINPAWSEKTKTAVKALLGKETAISLKHEPLGVIVDYGTIWFALSQVPLPEPPYPGHWVSIFLPQVWRDRLIVTMADDGFFDRATSDSKEWDAAKPLPQAYLLWVHVAGGAGKEIFHAENLGWSAETGKHLDALRKGMVGDAAKVMDDLLKKLEPARKEWDNNGVKPAAAK
jgi:hypothetical protein